MKAKHKSASKLVKVQLVEKKTYRNERERESLCVAQAGLECKIFLTLPPECLDYRHSPSCLVIHFFGSTRV
jgi:hypothetical protein